MSAAKQATTRPRFSLIAVLMFALLALATLAAWVIVLNRTGPHNRGAELVDRVRDEGLSSFWDRSPHERWFLIRRPDSTIGWRVEIRIPLPDGGFEGLTARLVGTADGSAGNWEYWRLNDDATTGQYQAGPIRLAAEAIGTSTNTQIELDEGTVDATQTVRGPHGRSVLARSMAPAPESYAPEGTVSLLRRLVAETGRDAAFHLVFNEQPPMGDRTSFGTLHMEPGELPDEDHPRAVSAVKAVSTAPQDRELTYLLDRDGEMVAVLADDTRVEAVEREEVLAEFPRASEAVSRLVRSHLTTTPDEDRSPSGPLEIIRRALERR